MRQGCDAASVLLVFTEHPVRIGYERHTCMSNTLKPKPDRGLVYEIRIMGHLSDQWTDWFGGLAITLEDNGETLLTGPVIDQSALHGLLRKVSHLGMPLISVV